jgi:uncharacterized protein with von Willebrand factor type A (vWA) domain
MLLYSKELSAEEGPVYVLLDKSGSMSGDKINWARAVALALLAKSRAAGRLFGVRFFDSVVYDLYTVRRGDRTRKVLEVIKYLATVKASGGTNITNAIARATDDVTSRSIGTTDIVLITDGEDKLSEHIISSIIKSGNVRLHSVMIGGHNPTLERVSNSYLAVRKLSEKEALKVVRVAFS